MSHPLRFERSGRDTLQHVMFNEHVPGRRSTWGLTHAAFAAHTRSLFLTASWKFMQQCPGNQRTSTRRGACAPVVENYAVSNHGQALTPADSTSWLWEDSAHTRHRGTAGNAAWGPNPPAPGSHRCAPGGWRERRGRRRATLAKGKSKELLPRPGDHLLHPKESSLWCAPSQEPGHP